MANPVVGKKVRSTEEILPDRSANLRSRRRDFSPFCSGEKKGIDGALAFAYLTHYETH
jgi:hypothetical protein